MSTAVARVQALVAGARHLADARTDLGRKARALLVESTGLSAEGVEWALAECLETEPSVAELDALCASVAPAPCVHVILPANVFVAAHRALALALAQSPRVRVKPSRREPHFAALLAEAAPGLFELTSEIAPAPGDHVWAYGGDESLARIRAQLPAGVHLHAHGPGFGVAVIAGAHATAEAAAALACDMAPFDQRGCLSPRAALILGEAAQAAAFGELLAGALHELAERVPLGHLDRDELADIARFRDASEYAGTLRQAGPGWLYVSASESPGLAPVGRNLHLAAVAEPEAALTALGPELVTAVGVGGSSHLVVRLQRALPEARVSSLGRMQRPAFDGPADRRTARGSAPS